MIGWEFRTQGAPVHATALSFFDDGGDGLLGAHDVGLYDKTMLTLIAKVTVPADTSAPLVGSFRTVPIPPVLLLPNSDYVLAASWPANSDVWIWNGGIYGVDLNGVAIDPHVSSGAATARYKDGSATLTYPTQSIADGRLFFVGPNVTVA